jgi:triacylglycerol lipase
VRRCSGAFGGRAQAELDEARNRASTKSAAAAAHSKALRAHHKPKRNANPDGTSQLAGDTVHDLRPLRVAAKEQRMQFTAWAGAVLSLFDGAPKTPVPPHPDRNPVLLVHGFADSQRNLRWMARHLQREGWEVHLLSLTPNLGQKGLEPLAGQIDAYARQEFGTRRFDLVGFSMGGLVSRYYVQRLGGLDRVDRLVTLSAPHNGSLLANLVPNQGCREMRPGSPFLRDLASDADKLEALKFTSFYTPFDLVILPPSSSEMPQARNVRLMVAAHPFMVLDRRCLRAVAEALRG